MTPEQHYQRGELRAAIQAAGEELKQHPLDSRRRTMLFELLLFAGEYDRAEKHLDVLARESGPAAGGAMLYRSALHAERIRQGMFLRQETPPVSDGEIAGTIDGRPFADIVDPDPRIGASLEVYIAGSYTWVPFRYIRRLEVVPPKSLRDLIWLRARLETSPEFRLTDLGEVLIPALAPLSWKQEDDELRLGRCVAWIEDPRYVAVPVGAKVLEIDGAEVPMAELRSLVCHPLTVEAADAVA